MSKEQVFVTVDREYLMELEEKAKNCDYFRGRIDGMEYVVDALQEALKGKEDVEILGCIAISDIDVPAFAQADTSQTERSE